MNIDLDTLRRNWKELDKASAPCPSGLFCSPQAVNAMSRLQKLMSYYRRLSLLGLVFVWFSPLALSRLNFPIWALVIISAYFALMSALCINMYRRLRSLDFGNTPIITLLEKVKSIYTLYNRQTTLGIMIASPLLLLILYFLHANEAAFAGGIIGAIVGIIIGIVNNIRFRRHILVLRNELSDALSQQQNG